jgi:penicillin amidase
MRSALRFSCVGLVAFAGSFCGGSQGSPSPRGPYDAVPVTTTVKITGLHAPVDVVRDKWGVVHIHASSIEDAVRVEGYQVARDRTAQLELIRRSATGRMAEVFGDVLPQLIDSDIAIRTVGLVRTAKEMVDASPPDVRAILDAYADGVSQLNARLVTGDEEMPAGMIGLSQNAFVPWTAVDVVAVARFQAFNLSYSADDEIALTDFVTAARAKMNATAQDPNLAKRAGFLVDIVRFAPQVLARPLDAFPNDPTGTLAYRPGRAGLAVRAFSPSREAIVAARAFGDAIRAARQMAGGAHIGATGSNNWIVSPSKTANGHALLANDPHLSLAAPAVFWMTHVTVDGDAKQEFAGTAFPGIPGVILGFNANVAWGATTADFDVTDVYEETLTADGSGVVYQGAPVPFEHVHESIGIAGKAPYDYDVVVVPHHGPVVPKITDHQVAPPSGKAMSVRWTGHKATTELPALFGLLRAKNVDDARAAYQGWQAGAQNWVFADTSGDIFYTTHAQIPKRDKRAFTWDPSTFTGTIPCLVLPGDGTAEWTGAYLEDAYIPHAKNPPQGFLATANTDQVGTTFDNDPTNDVLPNGEPMYLGCWHDAGFRLGRIQDRLANVGHPITLDDMAAIQSDARSGVGATLTAGLLASIAHAQEEASTPGTHKDLAALVTSQRWKDAPVAAIVDLLTRWGSDLGYEAASGLSPDDATPASDPKEADASRATAIFNVWVGHMGHLVLDDEERVIGGTPEQGYVDDRRVLMSLLTADPKGLATYDAALGDSILFDDLGTPEVETRDERAVHALLDAIDFLRARLGADTNGWRWGRLHTIRFTALVSLWKSLSIPQDPDDVFPLGFPRHGDGYNVDSAFYDTPVALDGNASFAYADGPTQRFVIEMDPKGPIGRNVLPGGNVWDSRDPHFRDEAELWRRNQNRPFAFAVGDVVGAAETRTIYQTP